MTPPPDAAPDSWVDRVELTPSGSGVRLRLRVKPSARSSEVVGEHGGALRVSVAAPPEKGRANEEAERVLAEALEVPRSSVRIVAGHSSRTKVAAVDSLAPQEARARLRGRARAGT